MVTTLYYDASVLTALALRDEGWTVVARLIATQTAPSIVTDFAWGEFVAALGARVRTREFHAEAAQTLIVEARADLLRGEPIGTSSADVVAATEFVGRFDLALKLPDAIHIAIARRLGATLLSTDKQQVAAARAIGVPCIDPLHPRPEDAR